MPPLLPFDLCSWCVIDEILICNISLLLDVTAADLALSRAANVLFVWWKNQTKAALCPSGLQLEDAALFLKQLSFFFYLLDFVSFFS